MIETEQRKKIESIKLAMLELMAPFTDGIGRGKLRQLYWFRQKAHYEEVDDSVIGICLVDLIASNYVICYDAKYYRTEKEF